MNGLLLKYIAARYGDTMQDLADALGIFPTTLSRKVNGKDEFKLREIRQIIERYSLTPEDVMRIFFTDEVAKSDTEGVE